ncbi:DUF6274 family protein [Streptomyces sp. NPDC050703]|uniref:DUF6274 family protein n=1 Tax=Streptomyces sp. NPDC050703 TaxID=3157218 RepID=UPI0034412C35
MSASSASARHETRALLRAHLAAATSYRHLTRHCPICHRLLRLAQEPSQTGSDGPEAPQAGFVRQDAVREEQDEVQGGVRGDEPPDDEGTGPPKSL